MDLPTYGWSWRLIISALQETKQGMKKFIANSVGTNVLFDPWISCISLNWLLTYINVNAPLQNLSISSLISNNAWNMELLSSFFGEDLIVRITSIYLLAHARDGTLIWVMDTHGQANAKFVYKFLSQQVLSLPGDGRPMWNKLWRVSIPPKLQVFFLKINT